MFDKIAADTRKILSSNKATLAGGSGDRNTFPTVSKKLISFNGIEDASHETCWFPKKIELNPWQSAHSKDLVFSCCKTAHKPYDKVVVAFHIIVKHYLGDQVEISSDGDDSAWDEGRFLAQSVLGYGEEYHLDDQSGELLKVEVEELAAAQS